MNKIWALVFFTLFEVYTAHAVIDMKNGNYNVTYIDWEAVTGSEGRAFRLLRAYNSRSLHIGIFGYGWCTDLLETKINVTPEGFLQLKECGAGVEVVYAPKGAPKKEVDRIINEIVARIKTTRKLEAPAEKKLRFDLTQDIELRTSLANQLKISNGQIKDKTVYTAVGRVGETIQIEAQKNNDFILLRTMADGTKQRFTKVGDSYRVSFQAYASTATITITYNKDGSINEVADNLGNRLRFSMNKGRVVAITGPKNLKLQYKYRNWEDLTYSKDFTGIVYEHEYDDLHNMTKIKYEDGKNVEIFHDPKKDWVTGFKDKEGCRESYTYEFDPKNPNYHYWSTLKKTCQNKVLVDARHEFFLDTQADGQTYFAKIISRTNADTTEINYHPKYGSPLSIIRNGEKTEFRYSTGGLVEQKLTPNQRFKFQYRPNSKNLAAVVVEDIDKKGKVLRKQQFKYTQNNQGSIERADAGPRYVQLTYDAAGRVQYLMDQSRQKLTFDYKGSETKPSRIAGIGTGAISFRYNEEGEISNTEIGVDEQSASSMLQVFTNYLDLIGPAVAEVFN